MNTSDFPIGVTLSGDLESGPILSVETAACTARISLRGGQVLSWQPIGHEPVLWLSPAAVFREDKSIRGGIPVCWPWFGDHASDSNKPAHGFARVRDWELAAIAADGEIITTELTLPIGNRDHALWPYRSRPRLMIKTGRDLRIALSLTNTDNETITFTEALHTYFSVSEISDVRVTGLDGATYYDKVIDKHGCRQSGDITFSSEVDRVYAHGEGAVMLHDSGRSRDVIVRQTSGQSIIVWNPWIEKTRRLGDMGGDDGYRHMLCIETGAALDNAIKLAPGETHTLETVIEIATFTA